MQSFQECINAHPMNRGNHANYGGGSRKRVFFPAALTLGVLLSLAASVTLAQSTACIGKTVPTKPIAMASCLNAAPACLTDQNGNNGRWIWSCPASTTPPPPMYQPPPQSSPADIPRALYLPNFNNPLQQRQPNCWSCASYVTNSCSSN